jgi:hypothetical protein
LSQEERKDAKLVLKERNAYKKELDELKKDTKPAHE